MTAAALIAAISVTALAAAQPVSLSHQPVPFSHKAHAAAGLKCQECHPNPDPGRAMTFPAAAKCMACHRTIAAEKASIGKLAELAKADRPIAWVRVAPLSAWVFWNHRPHLKAGVKCEACHGDVAGMDVVTQVTNANKMTGCLGCHREKKATVECASCHDVN